MKQVLPLIRIQLMEFFPLTALKNTSDAGAKKRARRKLTSTLVTFLACVYMSGVYSMGMLNGGLDGATYTLAPALMLMAGSVLGAITTLTKAGPVLFSAAILSDVIPMYSSSAIHIALSSRALWPSWSTLNVPATATLVACMISSHERPFIAISTIR